MIKFRCLVNGMSSVRADVRLASDWFPEPGMWDFGDLLGHPSTQAYIRRLSDTYPVRPSDFSAALRCYAQPRRI